MKGGKNMACEHKRIKSVNCEIFCMDCGEKLPIDYLVAKPRIAEQNKQEAEQPKKATRKKAAK